METVKSGNSSEITGTIIETPIGPMLAVGDDEALLLLEFLDDQEDYPASKIRPLSVQSIEKELKLYFAGKLREFKTPLHLQGTEFQISVWKELAKIPYGEITSYAEIAKQLGKPTAYRAVANANRVNRFPIVIPCHRVIKADGSLCGYNGGVNIKEWLLNHESAIP